MVLHNKKDYVQNLPKPKMKAVDIFKNWIKNDNKKNWTLFIICSPFSFKCRQTFYKTFSDCDEEI